MTKFKTLIVAALASTAFANVAQSAELRMSWWGGDSRHKATQAAVKVCGDKHGHTVKPEFTGWSGHFEKVATQIAGGTEADIMQINWPWLPVFSSKGTGFADLKDYKDIIDLSNWDAAQIDAGSINGHLNGLPVSTTGRIFFFNKTTWDKAGLALPKTMADLIAAGPVFKEKLGDDYFPFESKGLDAALLMTLFGTQATGKPLIDPATNKILWSEAEAISAIEGYKNMVDNHVIQDWKSYAAAGKVKLHENQNWTSGKIAGTYLWDSVYNKITDPLEAGQKLVPVGVLSQAGAKTPGIYRKASMVFSISKTTKNGKAAAQIVNCLLNEKEGVSALGATRGVPASIGAKTQLLSDNAIKQVQLDAQNMVLDAKGPAIHPYMEHNDVRNAMKDALELYAYGEIDAKTAAQEMMANINDALKKL